MANNCAIKSLLLVIHFFCILFDIRRNKKSSTIHGPINFSGLSLKIFTKFRSVNSHLMIQWIKELRKRYLWSKDASWLFVSPMRFELLLDGAHILVTQSWTHRNHGKKFRGQAACAVRRICNSNQEATDDATAPTLSKVSTQDDQIEIMHQPIWVLQEIYFSLLT